MLSPTETVLVGGWAVDGSSAVKDVVCKRIEALVASDLVELARSQDGWSTLYRDPSDGRLWELSYPESQMHGGGPPTLRYVKESDLRGRYANVA